MDIQQQGRGALLSTLPKVIVDCPQRDWDGVETGKTQCCGLDCIQQDLPLRDHNFPELSALYYGEKKKKKYNVSLF